jgi:serine protease Do
MRIVGLALLALILPLQARADLDVEMYHKLSASILKVQAVRPNGVVNIGSAVMVAPGKFVSNCHVTRGAKTVYVTRGAMSYPVESQVADVHHDVCMLSVPGAVLASPVSISTGKLTIGQPVFAAGFSGGRGLNYTEGEVKGLHQLDGGRVIQTSAPFTSGASGGGLFNREGQLVGIITFRSMADGKSYFALPIEWLHNFSANERKVSAFWQAQNEEQPYFLRACALEAGRDWNALMNLAQEWAQSENFNPEAWIALGKAYANLRRSAQAISAFHRAVGFDPSHVEGWTQLGALYLESGDFAEAHNAEVALSHIR